MIHINKLFIIGQIIAIAVEITISVYRVSRRSCAGLFRLLQ